MKKLVLCFVIIFSILFVSCGNSNKSVSLSQNTNSAQISAEKSQSKDKAADKMFMNDNTGEVNNKVDENSADSSPINQAAGRKIIENGNISIDTTRFDQSLATLENMINTYGGYIESSNIYSGGMNESNYKNNRYADYTIRIPSDKFREFLDKSNDLGVVTSKSTDANDVTSSYFDTEARLKVLQEEEQRYLAILNNTGTMSEMLEVEKALSEVRYNIETLTGSLKQMDELVNLSTVNIHVDEVEKVQEEKDVPVTFMDKIKDGFLNSISGVLALLSGLVIFIIAAIPYLILIAIVVIVIILIVKKIKKNRIKE